MPQKSDETTATPPMDHTPRQIILGVTGGIAAYKAADLTSKLVQAGARVRVAFSPSAHQFIAPLTFEALCGHPVYQGIFGAPNSYEMEHISWARWADALVIAPASADTLARMAHGLADCPLTTLYLAFRGQTYVAPSMNTAMLHHPAARANLDLLTQRGVKVITPGSGSLACGEVGSGRMAEPAEIMAALGITPLGGAPASPAAAPGHSPSMPPPPPSEAPLSRPADETLRGVTVVITSGPTREYLDPVRFISNPSSGRMGYALAREAMRRGAHVHYVTGPIDDRFIPHGNVTLHPVETAREMHQVVHELKDDARLFIFAAAVGDFRPANPINQKIKRTGNSISLPLVENPDIAQSIGFAKQPGQVTIGFAAETNDLDTNGQAKLQRKHLDAIVINDVSNPAIGFSSPNNEVQIITTHGDTIHLPHAPKEDIAHGILETAVHLLQG